MNAVIYRVNQYWDDAEPFYPGNQKKNVTGQKILKSETKNNKAEINRTKTMKYNTDKVSDYRWDKTDDKIYLKGIALVFL